MKRLGTIALALGLAFFFGVPLCLLLWQARAPGLEWTEVWLAPASLQALAGTLVTSLGAATFAFSIAVPMALLIGRTNLPLRGALQAVFTLPAALPPFILGMGWVSLANPRAGLLNLLYERPAPRIRRGGSSGPGLSVQVTSDPQRVGPCT